MNTVKAKCALCQKLILLGEKYVYSFLNNVYVHRRCPEPQKEPAK